MPLLAADVWHRCTLARQWAAKGRGERQVCEDEQESSPAPTYLSSCIDLLSTDFHGAMLPPPPPPLLLLLLLLCPTCPRRALSPLLLLRRGPRCRRVLLVVRGPDTVWQSDETGVAMPRIWWLQGVAWLL